MQTLRLWLPFHEAPQRRMLWACEFGLAWLFVGGCTPLPGPGGGVIPPPVIDDNGSSDGGSNGGDDGGSGEPSQPIVRVFDVAISASSLSTGGISVQATLTVTSEPGGDGDSSQITEVVLRDEFNDYESGADVGGIAGGVFLTARSASQFESDTVLALSEPAGGAVEAELQQIAGNNRNRFILPAEGEPFTPGAIGTTFEVAAGSRFTFTIEDGRVTGDIDLQGPPVAEPGNSDVYTGQFTGTQQP